MMTQGDGVMALAQAESGKAPLFDASGRRLPYKGMRVHNAVSQNYFVTMQPEVCSGETYDRVCAHMRLAAMPLSVERFVDVWTGIMNGLQAADSLSNLANAVHVPFICPPIGAADSRRQDAHKLLGAVERSLLELYPYGSFKNFYPDKLNESLGVAPGSRYERLEAARNRGFVVGVYFPNCLSEFDVPSQRKQMASLPEVVSFEGGVASIVLSGIADAAAAMVGTPHLLFHKANEERYPHHLCLSALAEQDDNVVYTFEHYAKGMLWFMRRNRILIPGVEQLSEQWAGGLTVFTAI